MRAHNRQRLGRRGLFSTTATAFLAVVLGLGLLAGLPRFAVAAPGPRPSFVVIQTDDQPIEEFHGTWRDELGRNRPIMPNAQRLLRKEGVEFTNYVTPFPLCAPSRASLLSGNYTHNHDVLRVGGEFGGWSAFRNNVIDQQNLAVWLQRSGYRTSHFGKFMNFYGGRDSPEETEVPPGWDRWVSDNTDNSTRAFYGYSQNIDGVSTGPLGDSLYGPETGRDPLGCPWLDAGTCLYHSDSISLAAVDEIRNAGNRPFYLQIDYHTPHGDMRPPLGPEPAPRHIDTASTTPRPTPPGFDEQNVFDKPSYIRELELLSPDEKWQVKVDYQKSVEALRSVDEAVGWIYDALRDAGKLRNTYIVFTSDNGYFLGQHRVTRGKLLPYEPALKVPMVITGPGIRHNSTSRELVANQDIAPTVLGLAGASAGRRMDGRSMERFWRSPNRRSRRAILVSSYAAANPDPGDQYSWKGSLSDHPASGGAVVSGLVKRLNYVGVRLGPYKYVEYGSGEHELYQLGRDPAELHNKAGLPNWAEIERHMRIALRSMRHCRAAACRSVQDPWPSPPGSSTQRGGHRNQRH